MVCAGATEYLLVGIYLLRGRLLQVGRLAATCPCPGMGSAWLLSTSVQHTGPGTFLLGKMPRLPRGGSNKVWPPRHGHASGWMGGMAWLS